MTWIKKHFLKFLKETSSKAIRYFILILSAICIVLLFVSRMEVKWICGIILISQSIGFFNSSFWRMEYAILSMLFLPLGKLISFLALALIFYFILFPISLFRSKKFSEGWKPSNEIIDGSKMYD